jgi:putative spermidine/putrescine transport system substrate-binding protein
MTTNFDRRAFLFTAVSGAMTLALTGRSRTAYAQAKPTLNFADIGVGDPGSWAKFTTASGAGVNLVAIGNAPSAVLNVLVAGGGRSTYDIINIVGGM